MRTYGKQFVYKKSATFQERANRAATEWDVRLDVSETLTARQIVDNVKAAGTDVSYAFVSGVERPDQHHTDSTNLYGQQIWKTNGSVSHEHHVHIAIIVESPVNRATILKLLRGPRKLTDEYAVPRNPKFTYAGWIVHHNKPQYKLEGEPTCHYESGDLPMDPYTTDSAAKVERMLKKWGTDAMRQRFEGYTKMVSREAIQQQIERLQMQLEDNSA